MSTELCSIYRIGHGQQPGTMDSVTHGVMSNMCPNRINTHPPHKQSTYIKYYAAIVFGILYVHENPRACRQADVSGTAVGPEAEGANLIGAVCHPPVTRIVCVFDIST